ncbi:unnamed protein product [Vitrella brassicaformis CCMP3155]|uniref:Uncharacterized protein n=2 Tax=Vitrella brassicaformis TaxID=1169539 RepID=A0A0G4E9R3_VITBC|nr:unnamed protein product [Vitrella brassicaformis CCMP3155]|mmetsp:Transcript_39371/g.98494  ORF Transcript_39371/g.98494 Transcript_39371/m.98494 type:complete len:354 (+) Transcript_39371:120-1181(+)|eukprot:CEL91922.1 unnamed protein product [Vitrella brassicaformis CCMP3155]
MSLMRLFSRRESTASTAHTVSQAGTTQFSTSQLFDKATGAPTSHKGHHRESQQAATTPNKGAGLPPRPDYGRIICDLRQRLSESQTACEEKDEEVRLKDEQHKELGRKVEELERCVGEKQEDAREAREREDKMRSLYEAACRKADADIETLTAHLDHEYPWREALAHLATLIPPTAQSRHAGSASASPASRSSATHTNNYFPFSTLPASLSPKSSKALQSEGGEPLSPSTRLDFLPHNASGDVREMAAMVVGVLDGMREYVREVGMACEGRREEFERLKEENKALREVVDAPRTCIHCGAKYSLLKNGPEDCVYHPGKMKFYSCSSCGGAKYFTCCMKCTECSAGCRTGYHVS